jgi:outer membrane protein
MWQRIMHGIFKMNTFKAAVVTSLLVCAGSSSAMDLLSVYRAAKLHDPVFSAAEADYRAGLEKHHQGDALWRPKVDVVLNKLRNNLSESLPAQDSNIAGTGNSKSYNLTVSQPLYDAAASVGSAQLNEQAHQAELNLRLAKQSLILRVAQAYFDVLDAEDSLKFLQLQKDVVGKQLSRAKESFKAGTIGVTDTYQAQASYDAVVANTIVAENTLEVKRDAFTALTGLSPERLDPLPENVTMPAPNPDLLPVSLQKSNADNLDIALQQSALTVASAEIDKYRVIRQPTLRLVAQVSSTMYQGAYARAQNINRLHDASIGVQLNIPLYTGGNTSSKYRESIALRDSARSTLESSRIRAAQDTKLAYRNIYFGSSQIKALQQAENSAQHALDSTVRAIEVGAHTITDVLLAQQQLFAAKQSLAQVRYGYILNKLNLQKATGELSESTLGEMNNLLVHP